jgi:hypothetical protein
LPAGGAHGSGALKGERNGNYRCSAVNQTTAKSSLPSVKGSRKLLWSVMPEAPIAADAGMRAGVSSQGQTRRR